MIRWLVTQMLEPGERFHKPYRFWTDRLDTARAVIYAMGGRWRVERQYRYSDGRWRSDQGRDAVREIAA